MRGSTYLSPMPIEFDVKNKIRAIHDLKEDGADIGPSNPFLLGVRLACIGLNGEEEP